MTQGKTVVLLIVVFGVGLSAGFVLRPVIAPPSAAVAAAGQTASSPQSGEAPGIQYFVANADEARQVATGCREGSVRGGECTNAEEAIIKTDAEERRRRFLGE